MTDRQRIGQKIKLTLNGGFHYQGTIIAEDDILLTIKDKFEKEVSFSKNNIISMEVLY